MDEQEWLSSNDPVRMLTYLNEVTESVYGHSTVRGRQLSPRKLRLFACAIARQVWDGAVCQKCKGTGKELMPWYGDNPVSSTAAVVTHRTLIMNSPCPDCRGTGRVGGLADPRSRRAVEVAERYADGEATTEELAKASVMVLAVGNKDWSAYPAVATQRIDLALGSVWSRPEGVRGMPPLATQANLLRDIVGNPFRKPPWFWEDGKPWEHDPGSVPGSRRWRVPAWLTHNDGAVAKMARVIYDSRRWDELPILADALEESGCCAIPCPVCRGERTIVVHAGIGGVVSEWCGHCSRTGLVPNPILAHLRGPGPHARGCHVLDLLLGRE